MLDLSHPETIKREMFSLPQFAASEDLNFVMPIPVSNVGVSPKSVQQQFGDQFRGRPEVGTGGATAVLRPRNLN